MAGSLDTSPVLLQLGCHHCGAVGCREREREEKKGKREDEERSGKEEPEREGEKGMIQKMYICQCQV